MADKWICINCGEPIGHWDKVCSNCGYHQFGEHDEYYPTTGDVRRAKRMLSQGDRKKRRRKEPVFADEEILALGLHPEDEGYKMSLISKILGRR